MNLGVFNESEHFGVLSGQILGVLERILSSSLKKGWVLGSQYPPNITADRTAVAGDRKKQKLATDACIGV
jgi:hypothetical protein